MLSEFTCMSESKHIPYLTSEEKNIWNSTYASSFAIEKSKCMPLEDDHYCELAIYRADAAVSSLRRWRETEDKMAGWGV